MPALRRSSPADPRSREAAFAAVAAALWTEGEILDLLQFRLVGERLLLSAGAARWLSRVDDEIRTQLVRLHEQEVVRAAEVEGLVRSLGLDAAASLQDILAVAPEPWEMVLSDNRATLRGLLHEIETGLAENERLLRDGAESTRRSLDRLAPSDPGTSAQAPERADLSDLTTSQLALQLAGAAASYDTALQTVRAIDARTLHEFLD